MAKGISNHQSSTLLFDPAMGHAVGLVSANCINGIRAGAELEPRDWPGCRCRKHRKAPANGAAIMVDY